jgi:hypothetical protein
MTTTHVLAVVVLAKRVTQKRWRQTMKLDVIKTAVTSNVGRQILIAQKNSPTIFFVGGVVGVVASTVLACKATLKLEEVFDEADRDNARANMLQHVDYSEQDRKSDLLKIRVRTAGKVLKLYSPAIAVGVVSIGALTGSHVTLTRRNAAVMAAYSALDKGFNDYRARVRNEFGEEKDFELRHGTEIVEETVEGKDGPKKVDRSVVSPGDSPSIYARWFDDGSSAWSREADYNRAFLSAQQNWFNDRLRARGHVFLNEIYDELKIPRTKEGQVVGWLKDGDGDGYIDFGIFDGGNWKKRDFVNTRERAILLDFNVDGVIYDKI